MNPSPHRSTDAPDGWTCPRCGQANAHSDVMCTLCGDLRPDPAVPPSEQWSPPRQVKVPPLEQPDTTLGFVPDYWFLRSFPASLLFLRFYRPGSGRLGWVPAPRVLLVAFGILIAARLGVGLIVRALLIRHGVDIVPPR